MSTEPDPVTEPPTLTDLTGVAVADLDVQESTVTRILDLLDEAARLVAAGQPRWVDPEMFGGTVKGERMARHTLRAQGRVYEALDIAVATLAQHHGSLVQFRDEVRQVEDDMAAQAASLRASSEVSW